MLSISQVAFSRWHPYSILKSSVIAVETEDDLSSFLVWSLVSVPLVIRTSTAARVISDPSPHGACLPHLLGAASPRLLKKHEGSLPGTSTVTIVRNGEIYPATELFDIMDDPPVISVLPVPPPHVRPPLFVNGELKGENDLTYRLQNIIRKNKQLAELKRCKRPPRLSLKVGRGCRTL